MNKNIKIIDEDLWEVDFDHVKMGFIKEARFSHAEPEQSIGLTQGGQILLNKKKPIDDTIIQYLKIIMKLPEKQLPCDKDFYNCLRIILPQTKGFSDKRMRKYIKKMNLNKYQKLFLLLVDCEKARRELKVVSSGLISEANRKEGEKNGQHWHSN